MTESSFFPDNVIILNAVSILSDCHIITPGSTPDYPVPLFFREAGEEGNLVTVDYELPAAFQLPAAPGACINSDFLIVFVILVVFDEVSVHPADNAFRKA